MNYEVRELVISVLVGILVAGLIFVGAVASFWSKPETTFPIVDLDDKPLTVNVILSNLTEPFGVGSEGVLTVFVTSKRDATNVVATLNLSQVIDYPRGLSFVDTDLATWNGSLTANVSISFNARIKATKVGLTHIRAIATWERETRRYESQISLWVLVTEEDIQVSYDPISPPGVNELTPYPPGNFTIVPP